MDGYTLITLQDLRVKENDTAIRISTPVEHLAYKPEIEGVTVHANGELQFSKPLFNRLTAGFVTLHLSGAQVQTPPLPTTTKLVAPTEKDLKIINESHALRELADDEIKIYERWVINNQPSRTGLLFTDRALKKFAADFAQGRTVLLYHNQQMPLGRTFAGKTAKATIREIKGTWVVVRLYIPTVDADGDALDYTRMPITMLDTGVFAFDSIGFGGGRLKGKRVGEGEHERFYLEIDYDPGQQMELEAGELSFVFMGNIRGAGNNKQSASMEKLSFESGVMPESDTGDEAKPSAPGTQGDPAATSQESTTVIKRWL